MLNAFFKRGVEILKKIILGIIAFIIFPITIFAADYDIKNYYIDVTIKENGDMEVEELIVMKGTFNGYEVGIKYNTNNSYSASNMTDVYIGAIPNPKNISFDTLKEKSEQFEKTLYATNGDKRKYIETNTTGKNNYRMYYKTDQATTAFVFKYTLKDVLILHNDVAELYWNFFDTSFNDSVKDLNIRIKLPQKLNEEDFNWWFHGDITGNSKYINDLEHTYITAHLNSLEKNSPVDFRVLLPTQLFDRNLVKKQRNDDVKNSIIATEDEIVRKDLEQIAYVKKIYTRSVIMTVIFYIVLVIVWIYSYFKFDKERKPVFQNDYNREFIEDYNVEVIDYLMNKNITPNAMSASIMNLIYKKNIRCEEIENEKETKNKNYKFILINRDNLNLSENLLVNFLFEKVGEGQEFTTVDLKRYASSPKYCSEFMKSYNGWKDSVYHDGEEQKFFDKSTGKAKYAFLIFILAVGVSSYVFKYNVEFIPAYCALFAAIIYIIYLMLCTRKSEKGIEHFTKWNAFKNFLKDFGTFPTKELPEIILWERYLVYATIFGLADQVEKTMNVRIKEINPDYMMMDNRYFYTHIHMAPVINSSIRSAYNSSQMAINAKNASAVGGSFGGHGGGFSSGGGGGGGGRSGGGF